MGSKAAVDFHHGNANYVTINEVVGSKLSEVAGRIRVDQGQLYILNPQGIVYHDGATIEGSVIMGTNSLNRDAFYENGQVLLNAPDTSGPVLINGNLTIKEAGLLGIVAPYFSNRGHITGELHVAAGKEIRVNFGDKRLSFTINGKLKEAFIHTNKESSIEGRAVTMTVGTAEKVLDETIRIDGHIKAQELTEEGGRIILKGGDEGGVVISGTLDASGKMNLTGAPDSSPGGVISVTGHITKAEDTAILDASGTTGGKILFGVDEEFQRKADTDQILKHPSVKASYVTIHPDVKINADGTTGKGGAVIAIGKKSIDVQEGATISVTSQTNNLGGFVEISGEEIKAVPSQISLGSGGALFFDPGTILIAPTSGGTGFLTTGTTILGYLNSGTDVTLATSLFSTGTDVINIQDSIGTSLAPWHGSGSLTLIGAALNMSSGNTIKSTGSGNLNLKVSYSNTNLTSSLGAISIGGTIDFSGGTGKIRTFTTMATGNQGITHASAILSGPMSNQATDNGGRISGTIQNFVNIYQFPVGGSQGPTLGEYWYGYDFLQGPAAGSGPTISLSGNYAFVTDMNMLGENWSPIGNIGSPFTGTFIGNSFGMKNLSPGQYVVTTNTPYVVSGLSPVYTFPNVSSSSTPSVLGFFGALQGATLDSWALDYCGFGAVTPSSGTVSSTVYIGLLGGYVTGSTLNNFSVTSTSGQSFLNFDIRAETATSYVGGLFGQVTDSVLTNIMTAGQTVITNHANYTGPANFYLGNIVGQLVQSTSTSSISHATNTGLVNFAHSDSDASILTGGSVYIGGIVGNATSNTTLSLNTNVGIIKKETSNGSGNLTNVYMGGIVGKSTGATLSQSSNFGQTRLTHTSGFTMTNLYQGGISGSQDGGSLSGVSNSGHITLSLAGADAITNLYQGGISGLLASVTTYSSNNAIGTISVANSGAAGTGTISTIVAIGGFAGSITGGLSGTEENPNTSGVAINITNGAYSYAGTFGTNTGIGGFSGITSGDISYAQSLGTVAMNDVINSGSTGNFYLAALIGKSSGTISNCSSTGAVYYTEGSSSSNALYMGGITATTSGTSITGSSFNGSLSTTINNNASLAGVYMAGIAANSTGSSLDLQTSSMGSSASISLTNNGTINTTSLGGLIATPTTTVNLFSSSNQGDMLFTNNGTINSSTYLGGIFAQTGPGSTASQVFYNGNTTFSNTLNASTNSIYMGGFAATGASSGTPSAANSYTAGTLNFTNAGTAGAPGGGSSINIGGFMGSTNNQAISTSYTRTTISTSNTGTLNTTQNVGGFAGTNSGTINSSYILQSALPIIAVGSSSGVTSLPPLQMVQQRSFPPFDFTNVWVIQEWFSTPYFAASGYIPSVSGFEFESLYPQYIARTLQNLQTFLHDHRTLISLEDPMKSVTVESPLQNEGFSLFGHEDMVHLTNGSSFKAEEEKSLELFAP